MLIFDKVYACIPVFNSGESNGTCFGAKYLLKILYFVEKTRFLPFLSHFLIFSKKIIFSTKKFEPKTSPIDSSWSKTVNMKWKWRFWDKNQLFINFLNIRLKNQKGPPLWFFLRFEKNFRQTKVISPSKSTMKNRLALKKIFLTLRVTMW